MDKWTPNTWTIAWGLWIAMGVVMEFVALRRHQPNDTLSEQVWGAFAMPGYGKFIAWMFTAFLIWMAVHFASRGKWG